MDGLNFDEMTQSELDIVGSGVGGAILGGMTGWTLGLPVTLVYALVTGGKNDKDDFLNICNTCATVGAYLGALTPGL